MFPVRRTLNLAEAAARPAAAADHGRISRLLASARHSFLAVPSAELGRLIASEPGALLVSGDAVWAAAIAERTAPTVAWLRALALADGLPQQEGLDALLAAYHGRLREAGVGRAFYAGYASDVWLRVALAARGYVRHTEVVSYEKVRMDIPAPGSSEVLVRRAAPPDLAAVLAVDHSAFAEQWHKDQHALGPAIGSSPCFLVAERPGAGPGGSGVVGYAFVTSHFEGRLVHLVRIAVLPAFQGQGVGVRLLAEVVAYARGAGAHTLTLNTQEDNLAARRLYEWFGFRQAGERQTVMEFAL